MSQPGNSDLFANMMASAIAMRPVQHESTLSENKDTNYSEITKKNPIELVTDDLYELMITLIPKVIERETFLDVANTSPDQDKWIIYAEQQNQHLLELLVLQTFRNRLQVAQIDRRDEKCLRWLCKLYLGYLPNDDQLRNLPYVVHPQNTHHQAVSFIWGHLMALTDTLLELRDFYHAGYVHLLSRKESQDELHEFGQYLFRMSNMDIGTIILSTTNYHLYLSTDRYVQTGFGPMPLVPNTKRVRYIDKEFVISQWNLEMIKKLLASESKRLGIVTPMMGAVPLDELTTVYSSKVAAEYINLTTTTQQRYVAM